MTSSARLIKRPALLGMVAAFALAATIAASLSLAAQAGALRGGQAKGVAGQAQIQPES